MNILGEYLIQKEEDVDEEEQLRDEGKKKLATHSDLSLLPLTFTDSSIHLIRTLSPLL